MSEAELRDEENYDPDFLTGDVYCWHCSGDHWKHACCSDMCISCYEPAECPDAIPCRHCNPNGEYD